jgi:hypothetical protein
MSSGGRRPQSVRVEVKGRTNICPLSSASSDPIVFGIHSLLTSPSPKPQTRCSDLATSQLDDAVGMCQTYFQISLLIRAADCATSEFLPSGSEDIALDLKICDHIRSKSAPARDATRAIKQTLNHKNPNVQLLALGVRKMVQHRGHGV